MRRVPSSGGFYSFISHGLGRPLGMASGWAGILSYAVVTCSLLGAFGYFGNITIDQFFHVSIPWPILGFGALVLMGILGHFDIRFNAHILGVALVLEMVVLAVMERPSSLSSYCVRAGLWSTSTLDSNSYSNLKGTSRGSRPSSDGRRATPPERAALWP